MSNLRIVRNFSHPDEVSGTSVFSDGTKAYWGERLTVFIKRDGTTWEETSWLPPAARSDYLNLLMNDTEFVFFRPMTMAELVEWEECFSMQVESLLVRHMAVAC